MRPRRLLPRTLPLLALASIACGAENEDGPVPQLVSAQLTRLELVREPGPVFINERIPIVLGITAQSADPGAPATADVPVLISFVDAEDPDNEDLSCAPNALDLELVGDGTERTYEGVIWPISECGGLFGRPAVLKVEMDPEGEVGELAAPMVLSQARAGEPANAACGGPNPGCVHSLELVFGTTGSDGQSRVDVKYVELVPDSAVAVMPVDPSSRPNANPADPEDLRPALTVQSQLLLNGRHPYESAVDPATVPEELVAGDPELLEELRFGLSPSDVETLNDLPGTVRLRYAMSAASDRQLFLPLTIQGAERREAEVRITELTPGVPNDFTHELFIEGETLRAVQSGPWAGQDRFVIRGCFTTDFEELRVAPADGECQSTEVMLIEDSDAVEGGAVSLSFNQVRRFRHGNRRIRVEAEFSTQNILTPVRIAASGEAELRLRGKIGRSYNVQLFQASGSLEAGLDEPEEEEEEEEEDDSNGNSSGGGNNSGGGSSGGGSSGGGNSSGGDGGRDRDRLPDGIQEIDVRIFGIDVLSKRSEGEEIEEEDPFTISRSRRVFAGRFGFGPIGLSFDFHVGGQAGLNAEANIGAFDGDDLCRPHLPLPPDAPRLRSCLTLGTLMEPFVALTAEAFGGINRRIVKAGVAVELTIARFGVPLESTLSLGVDAADEVLVHAGVKQRLTFQPIEGVLKLVGRIRIFRRTRSRSVTIVSFRARERSRTLFSREMPFAEALDR